EKTPRGFERIRYIEQPTARDLEKHRENTMREAAKLRPVVIDESLTGLDRLILARDLGYTGVALKACKGQSQALLMAAAAQEIQDVPLRSRSDLSRRIPCTFRRPGSARAGCNCSRGQCPPVHANREQALGAEVSGNLPRQGWNDAHRGPERTRSGSSDIVGRRTIP